MKVFASCQVVGFLETLPILYITRSSEIKEEVVQLQLSHEKRKKTLHHGMVALGQLIRFLFKTKVEHAVVKCKCKIPKAKMKGNFTLQDFCKQLSQATLGEQKLICKAYLFSY